MSYQFPHYHNGLGDTAPAPVVSVPPPPLTTLFGLSSTTWLCLLIGGFAYLVYVEEAELNRKPRSRRKPNATRVANRRGGGFAGGHRTAREEREEREQEKKEAERLEAIKRGEGRYEPLQWR